MDSFHDVRFPPGIGFGATGGPERINEIVLLSSGRERRNARLSQSRRRYDAGTGIRSAEDLYDLVAFFEARRGSLHGFRFRDPFDMKSCRPSAAVGPADQAIGTGDGVETRFQLAKRYGSGDDAFLRAITKPVAGAVRVAVGGIEKASPSAFDVDHLTGIVTFASGHAPGAGETVTAGFEFDVPVRFDCEHLSASLTAFKAGHIPTVPLLEILG